MKKVANLARIKTDSTYTGSARKMYNEALVGKKGEIFSVCEAFCAFILQWYRTYYTYDRLCVWSYCVSIRHKENVNDPTATWVAVTDIRAILNKRCFAKVEPRTIEICNNKQNLQPTQAYAW